MNARLAYLLFALLLLIVLVIGACATTEPR